MAKKKHFIYRFHKIKVHHNRWLIWAIAYAVIVAIGLIGYVKVSEVNFESQFTSENIFLPWHSYSNSKLGFSVRYPADWSIESNSKTAIDFVPKDLASEGVTIDVESPAAEKALRKIMDITAEKSIIVDGVKGRQMTNHLSLEAFETVVLAKHNNKLYVISGSNDFMQKFLLTLRFLPY